MKPEPFDPKSASDDELRARYLFEQQQSAEMDPDTPVYPFEDWAKNMRQTSPFQDTRRWVVWDEGRERIVATGYVGLNRTEDNRHLAQFDINVLPDARRHGLGRSLLREIVAIAEADERRVLGGGTVQGHDAEHFLDACGFAQKMLERRSRCYVQHVPQEMLDDWIATGAQKASEAGYSLIFLEQPIPTEHRAGFLDVLATMNDREWIIVVRHDATGEYVSFTGIDWHPSLPQLIWQGGTAVKPAHRGHAIGRWVKASMMQKIRTELPEAEFVDTWNAGSNKWMLAINDDLGFRPYLWYTAWQGSVDDIKKAVGL
jgi:GNAT superfamily N-acetyltransferase